MFCGSAAGRVSALRGVYYGGPGNRFWPTLAETGLTPRPLAPEDFHRVTEFGLGLTDLCKAASGGDAELPSGADDPAALRTKILRFRPKILAFVGKRPAGVFLGRTPDYGAQAEAIAATRIYVLPSPSGAARRYWDVSWWRTLAGIVREEI